MHSMGTLRPPARAGSVMSQTAHHPTPPGAKPVLTACPFGVSSPCLAPERGRQTRVNSKRVPLEAAQASRFDWTRLQFAVCCWFVVRDV